MTQQEDYFPRGGIAKKTTEPVKKVHKTENLFSVSDDKSKTSKGKKSHKNQKSQENAEIDRGLRLESVDTLSYKKTQEGMLILGCVRQIKLVTFEVELPGRTHGMVLIKNISQPYSNRLQAQISGASDDLTNLNMLFTPGQFLPTKVLSIENKEDKGVRVYLSVDPVDINSMIRHMHLKKGMLVWGAISEKHDHGYVVDLGIPNSRAMLKTDNEEDEHKHYEIGQPFYSVITKCDSSVLGTIVTLSDKLNKEDLENPDVSIDHLIPGMQVKFTINTIIKHGLEGTFLNGYTGYINDLYLTCPLENLNKYKEGQVVKSRVMYVQPSTKFTYMTLRGLDRATGLDLKLGTKLQSQVRERLSSGLVVKMNATDLGFVTYNRIIKSLNSSKDFKDIINDKYAIGTNHQCVIIGRNNFERMYICTFDVNTQDDSFLTEDDFRIGQEVHATVSQIKPAGLVAHVGKLEALIKNIHLSSAIYSENIKSKFKVGQKVKARVWFIDRSNHRLHLTLKAEVSKDSRVLNVKRHNEQFLGMVTKTTKKGVIVTFLGNMTGWLPNKNIPQLSGNDASKIFYRGQIISCYVLSSLNGKIILTQNQDGKEEKTLESIKLGEIIESAKVVRVTPEGLDLKCDDRDFSIYLPAEHAWGKEVMHTYKEEDIIRKLVCICTKNKFVVSMNEIKHFRVLRAADFTKNAIIRCYFYKTTKKGFLFYAPSNKFKTVFVSEENFKATPTFKFEPFQVVYCKVINVAKNFIKASVNIEDLFAYTNENAYDYLSSYLERMQSTKDRFKLAGDSFVNFEIGQVVDCVVNKVDKKLGCSVFVKPHGCNGIVEASQMIKDLKPRAQCKAMVIGYNFEHKYIQLTMKENIVEKTKSKEKLSTVETCKNNYAQLLTVNKKYALGMHTSGHLIYFPMQLHCNDFNPQMDYYLAMVNSKIKVANCKLIEGRLFGIEKKMHSISLKIHREIIEKPTSRKRKQSETSSEVKKIKKTVEGDVEKKLNNDVEMEEAENNNDEPNSDEEEDAQDSEEEVEVDAQDSEEEELEVDAQGSEEEEDAQDSEEVEVDAQDSEEEELEVDTQGSEEEEDAQESEEECEHIAENDDDDEDNVYDPQEDSSDRGDASEEDSANEGEMEIEKTSEKDADFTLPGIDNFFENNKNDEEIADNTSSDEDEKDNEPAKKKKKLSSAERLELAKAEERRLQKIENELAESSNLPQSAEQFDRVLLGNPDDSEMWMRYIAFHTQATELEKARAVVKRALEKISYNASQDRLNIWLAYLNLENMYGTKATFDKVFEEASRCNDALTIYLESIKMLSEMQKFSEMDEKIKKVRAKFKQEPKMWLELAKVYYGCNRFADARKLKDIAITTITNKKTHVDLLVQFAILELNEGEEAHGEALFETIIQTDVRRVDVWCTYVDQLVKKGKIDIARNVLTRAVGQKLMYKKMRTLFKKYITFEKEHGNEESLERATNLLKEYTKQ